MVTSAQVFVYYRMTGDRSLAQQRIGDLFATVHERTGASGRLMMRCDDAQTWMEVYAPVDNVATFCAILQECVLQNGVEQSAKDGDRHIECFTAVAPPRGTRQSLASS